jgi:hypothetical protein
MQQIIPEFDVYSATLGAVGYIVLVIIFATYPRPRATRRTKGSCKKVPKEAAQWTYLSVSEAEKASEIESDSEEQKRRRIATAYAAEYSPDMYDTESPCRDANKSQVEEMDEENQFAEMVRHIPFPHLLVLLPLLAVVHTLRSSQLMESSKYTTANLLADMIPEQLLADIIEGHDDGLVRSTYATPVSTTNFAESTTGVQTSSPVASAFVAPDLVSETSVSSVLTQPTSANASKLYTVQLTRQPVPVNSNGATVYHKSAYFGELLVGEPAVKFTAVFDTGSGHLVLPSTYCRSDTCKAHTRYSRRASLYGRDVDFDGSTVMPGHPRDQITISFGTGEVSGVFVEDHVCLRLQGDGVDQQPQANELSVDQDLPEGCMKMRIIAATEMSEQPFKSFHFDGVLGLGLDGLSQTPEFNFLRVISSQLELKGFVVPSPETFAVFLADSDKETSEISFGGWKQEHLDGELGWNSIPDPKLGHWLVHIKSLRIGDETLKFCEDGSCQAAVDTGTSLLAVPTAIFPELYELLRHPAHRSGDCAFPGYGPEFHIELDNFTVSLSAKDYARPEKKKVDPDVPWESHLEKTSFDAYSRTRTDMHCKPALMTMDLPAPLGPKLFILGEPILRKFMTVYDAKQKRIGFGRAIHVKDEEIMEDDAEDTLPVGLQGASSSKHSSGSMFAAFKAARMKKLR